MNYKHLSFRRLKYLYLFPLLITFFTFIPIAQAGVSGPIAQTDAGADRLVYYFDTRDRKSYVQLVNLSNDPATVHVQVFISNSGFGICEEIDFFDTYTPTDVHTYDMENLLRNSDMVNPGVSIPAGSFGFVVISRSTGTANSLVGTMRIMDDSGYEYRANAAAPETAAPPTDDSLGGIVNFNNANGNSFSELIGFTYFIISPDTVIAGTNSGATFGGFATDDILIFNDNEVDISCAPFQFTCSPDRTNIAIDHSMPNANGNPIRVCNTSIIDPLTESGHLLLPFERFFCNDPILGDGAGNCIFEAHFVGFIGLTNGTTTGSFDSWWEVGESS